MSMCMGRNTWTDKGRDEDETGMTRVARNGRTSKLARHTEVM